MISIRNVKYYKISFVNIIFTNLVKKNKLYLIKLLGSRLIITLKKKKIINNCNNIGV